ncbi:MAG: chromate resistance protein ChrB domain-containing protein [Solirubrobacteraceae bacterium]
MTLGHLHLDRVASAWLIARFIDDQAEFQYLGWDEDRPEQQDLQLFGMPGLPELSSNDERGTCFRKLIDKYGLTDPGLELLERVVAAGVAHALGIDPPADLDDDLRCVGVGLDLVGIGFGVIADDAAHLAAALPLYDAIYRVCQSHTLPADIQSQVPRRPGERSAFLREALAVQ